MTSAALVGNTAHALDLGIITKRSFCAFGRIRPTVKMAKRLTKVIASFLWIKMHHRNRNINVLMILGIASQERRVVVFLFCFN